MCTGREREGKDICSSYMYTYADAVTWFRSHTCCGIQDPSLSAELRSGIQKYKTGIVHISLRAVSIEEGEEEMCTGRGRERRRYM